MNFATKLIISAITIGFTVFGGIYTGFEKIDNRMDDKVAKGKKEVIALVKVMNTNNRTLIKSQDTKVAVQIAAVNGEMIEMRKDIRAILGIARKHQVFVNSNKPLYTIQEPTISQGKHL
jgi:hypothetical protein